MINIKRILTPTDFSKGSEHAIRFAGTIASFWNAKVDVFHVVPMIKYLNESIMMLGLPLDIDRDVYPKLQQQAKENILKEMQAFLPVAVRGEAHVIVGRKPGVDIVERAHEGGYDLLVMSQQGAHAHLLSGGTPEHVVRYAHIPVLCVPPEAQAGEFTRVLVPTDGSLHSLAVLPAALQLAHTFKADISLLHVLELYGSVAEDVYIYRGETEVDAIREELIGKVKQFFQHRFGDRLTITDESFEELSLRWNEGVSAFTVNIKVVIRKSVSAHLEIVDFAEENADMIAMTTHGRTGLAHMLLGSTTEQVARHAKVPVLTFRPELKK
jgi:nucleotide-binding universal stress UspA family protein